MMFLIPNSVNVECFQLSQVEQNYSIDFIFLVEDTQLNEVVWFLAANTSTSRQRYDRFEIELVSEGFENPSVGQIFLPRGQFTYKVWEYNGGAIDQTGTTGDILEQGKVVVDIESKDNYTTNNIYE